MFLKPNYVIQIGADNPVLRKKSSLIEKIDEDIVSFANTLIQMMYEYDGVGLASPQLGENIRMVVTTQRRGKKLLKEVIMINPEIIEFSKEEAIDEEWCLSLPNVIGSVKRSVNIVVKYLDLFGKQKTKKLKGYNARIVQHEVDHLNGILFIDKIVKLKGEVESFSEYEKRGWN